MTLVVGVLARDGVVLASDSLATNSDTAGMRVSSQPSRKVHCCGPFIWGASGAFLITQDLERRLTPAWAQNAQVAANKSDGGRTFHKQWQQLQHQTHLDLTAFWQPLSPRDQHCGKPSAAVLVGGVLSDGPRLLLVEGTTDGNWVPREQGYEAIGSGAAYAHAILWRHRGRAPSLSMNLAKYIAYRAVHDACAVAPGDAMIRGPVQVACVSEGDAEACLLKDEELLDLGNRVEAWRELEYEFFRDFESKHNAPDGASDEATTLPEL